MSNASAMMQKLMDKYSISEMEIDASRDNQFKKEFEDKSSDTIMFNIMKWQFDLAHLIGRITHTKSFARKVVSKEGFRKTIEYSKDPNYKRNVAWTMIFFGDPTNVTIACELYYEWILKMDAMSAKAVDEYVAERRKLEKKYKAAGFDKGEIAMQLMRDPRYRFNGRIYRKSWIDGCIMGISLKVMEAEKSREPEVQTAIVLYDKSIEEEYKKKKIRQVAGSQSQQSAEAFNAGAKVGVNISITPTKKLVVKNKLLGAGK